MSFSTNKNNKMSVIINVSVSKTTDGQLFENFQDAVNHQNTLDKRNVLSTLRELERLQREDKKKMNNCPFRNEPAIWNQSNLQRQVKERSNTIRKLLDHISTM
jgi:hypothetical protein